MVVKFTGTEADPIPDILGSIYYKLPFFAGFAFAYFLGSIPFGLILTWFSGLGDVRKLGSGNIGATNVLRTGNKLLAALTLALDLGKGTAVVLIGARLGPDMMAITAIGVVLGHVFPIWLKFRGGKGVATTFGVLLALSWPVGLLGCLTWLTVFAFFRISSLSALLALAVTPFITWWLADPQRTEVIAALAILVWIRHVSNIRRLLKGNESRISFSNKND